MTGWGLICQRGSRHHNKDTGKSIAVFCQCPCYDRPWTEIFCSLCVENSTLKHKISQHDALRTKTFVFWSKRSSHFPSSCWFFSDFSYFLFILLRQSLQLWISVSVCLLAAIWHNNLPFPLPKYYGPRELFSEGWRTEPKFLLVSSCPGKGKSSTQHPSPTNSWKGSRVSPHMSCGVLSTVISLNCGVFFFNMSLSI